MRTSWLFRAALGACLLSVCPVAAATLLRGPYIQNVTSTSAVILWRNTTAANLVLEYGPTTAYGSQIVRTDAAQHEVQLTGLQPATRYFYRLSADGQILAGGANFSFRTAPFPGGGAGLRFLLWGDSGLGNTDQMKVAGQLVGQHADFAVHVGDIIYGSASLFYDDRYFTPYAALLRRAPVWAARGNHDQDIDTYTSVWHLPRNPVDGSELFYSFDYGDLHFTVLDSNALTPAMLAWAESDLRAATRRWKMLMLHHTIYSCGLYHASDSTNIALIPPIAQAGGADLVLYGHDHHFERSWPLRDGVPNGSGMNPDYVNPTAPIYVLSGGGCEARPLQTVTCGHVARAFSDLHFVRTFVDGDLLTLEAVDPTGAVRDRMSILKSATPAAGALDLVEPHGGEMLAPGGTLGVRWRSSATVGDVRIELSRGGANGPWETIVATTPNDGAEDVTLAAPTSSNCWVRIAEAADGQPWDVCDAAFGLESAGGPDFDAFVNFSPTSVVQPPGYVVDSGRSYDPVRGYGWDRTVDNEVRATHPDVRLDTYCSVTNPASALWQIAVPNGNYRVTLAAGDPSYAGVHRVEVEGTLVIDNVATDRTFVQITDLPVAVADGFLSVRLGGIAGSTKKSKLCYIDVQGAGGGSSPANLPPAIVATGTPVEGMAPLTVGFTAQASDPDGDAVSFAWTFGDGGAGNAATATRTYTTGGTYRAIATAFDPAGASAADTILITVTSPPSEPPPPPSEPPPGALAVRVNFQPATAAVPPGYSVDAGRKFDATRGWGWDTSLSGKARGKNPDLRLDSHLYITNPKAATWDVVLPNGQYRVTVVAGDPSGSGQHRIALQEVIAIPDVSTSDGQFATAADVLVTVTDGRLRMRIGGISGSSKKTKPCYIDITPVVAKAWEGALQPLRIDLSPNPADRAPVIQLTLDGDGPLRLELFDVRGRLVRSLYGGPATRGAMQLTWDRTDAGGTPVQSGVYFLRTAFGARTETRKVLVVR